MQREAGLELVYDLPYNSEIEEYTVDGQNKLSVFIARAPRGPSRHPYAENMRDRANCVDLGYGAFFLCEVGTEQAMKETPVQPPRGYDAGGRQLKRMSWKRCRERAGGPWNHRAEGYVRLEEASPGLKT
jgi:hypothetical protein